MPSATAAALRTRLLEAFPPDRPYRRADLSAEPMPPVVSHYLEHLLDERLRRHAQSALRGPFDADSAAVRTVRTGFLRALYTAAQFHTDEWEAALAEAADRSVAYLLRPARVLAAAVFERQRGTLPLPAVLTRMERFAGHDYFYEGVANYAAEPDTDPEIDDIGFAKLLVQIDTYVAARRSARGWVDSARPFLDLGRLFPEDPALAARLLQTFFDPRLPDVAERLQEERYGLDGGRLFTLLTDAGVPPEPLGDEPFSDDPNGPPTRAPGLRFELIEDFDADDEGMPPANEAHEPPPAELPPSELLPDTAPEPYQPTLDDDDVPDRDRGDGASTLRPDAARPALTLVQPVDPASESDAAGEPSSPDPLSATPATPEAAKAALEGDVVPLWQRFAKEPGSEAPLPAPPPGAPEPKTSHPAEDVWPPHARPADPSEREQKAAAPLWQQFIQKQEGAAPTAEAPDASSEAAAQPPSSPLPAAAAALSSRPPAAPASPRSLEHVEREVLGSKAAEKRAWFVHELFGDDADAYAHVLRRLSGTESWDESWKVIGAEVFRKHRVNIYGPAAVAFTDAVEARHKARAAGA